MDPSRLKGFEHIIVPMWELIPRVVGESRFEQLSKDERIVRVPLKERPLTRTEFRDLLKQAEIEPSLDFDSDKILVGRFANLVYNWSDGPVTVRVPEQADDIMLAPYAYRLLSD